MSITDPGTRVCMSEELKTKLRGQCSPGKHVESDADDDTCSACSLGHVLEFGHSIGIVQGPTDYNNVPPGDPAYDEAKVGPEVDVRWLPDMLRYAYAPAELVLAEDPNKTPVGKFPVATVLEVSLIGIFPASEYVTLQTLAAKVTEELREKFLKAGGRDVFPRWTEVRPATKEEVIFFTPRKIHFTKNGETHICDTAYVAKRNLTTDREKVTCKLCLRKLGITHWDTRGRRE